MNMPKQRWNSQPTTCFRDFFHMTRKENVTFLITELAKFESQVKLAWDSTSEKIILSS